MDSNLQEEKEKTKRNMEKNSGQRDEGAWDVMARSKEENTRQSIMERAGVSLMCIKARRGLGKVVNIACIIIVCNARMSNILKLFF